MAWGPTEQPKRWRTGNSLKGGRVRAGEEPFRKYGRACPDSVPWLGFAQKRLKVKCRKAPTMISAWYKSCAEALFEPFHHAHACWTDKADNERGLDMARTKSGKSLEGRRLRDLNTCTSCGFESHDMLVSVDLGVTLCPHCDAATHPQEMGPEFALVWLPEASQVELAHLCRMTALVISRSARGRSSAPNPLLKGAEVFAKMMAERVRAADRVIATLGGRDTLLLALAEEENSALGRGLRVVRLDFSDSEIEGWAYESTLKGWGDDFLKDEEWFIPELAGKIPRKASEQAKDSSEDDDLKGKDFDEILTSSSSGDDNFPSFGGDDSFGIKELEEIIKKGEPS